MVNLSARLGVPCFLTPLCFTFAIFLLFSACSLACFPEKEYICEQIYETNNRMTRIFCARLYGLLLAICMCFCSADLLALTEVHVEKAGTLSSLLTSPDAELKVTGVINGSDIKYIRQFVAAGKVTSLDWSGVSIVAGGEAYYESFTTSADVVGEKMFTECSKLQKMVLPVTVAAIQSNAFSKTGLTSIDIPNSVRTVGEDAFAYCNSLATVVIGAKVSKLSKGTFYSSAVKKVYSKPITPPAPESYLFSSKPTIYVYSEALADYKEMKWGQYGTLYGTLANFYPQEPGEGDIVGSLCETFFEDAACTTLKAEYQAMSDENLTAAFATAGMPDYMADIALKIKNDTWAAYEKEFRIQSYKPYSDADYWSEKLMARCGTYMNNPTGIYVQTYTDRLYVFVNEDVPTDATLYIAAAGVDQMITARKSGQKLKKGLNVIDGDADKLYYILYTVDTKSMTKRIEEWPDIKIHIEGGKVDGYFDATRHTDADYKKLLNAASNTTFVAKGKHAVMNIRTFIFKETYPNQIAKAVACLDSIALWEKELIGITEAVANGERAGAPYYLTGGDAFYPGYFNNLCYVDNDSHGSLAHATTYGIHLSYDATKTFLNPYISNYDENGTAHEFGHQLQDPINLEGCTEGSNDLFSCYARFFMGHRTSVGEPLSVMMQKYAEGVPFYWRGPNYGIIRMFWSLYLYYHQAQKNTSFYPELFKALRKDKLTMYGTNTNTSGLKFVRKVCEVAQEDLTDFFTVYGFFEPTTSKYLECYGDHYVTNRKLDINSTKRTIAQYEKKNREIIFIEDRVEHLPTTSLIPLDGTYRIGEAIGQFGDVGQFTSYLPEGSQPAQYVYYQADSLYAMVGTGGVGFLMLDADNNIKYASNSRSVCVPNSIGRDFTIWACDADGTLHPLEKKPGGVEYVTLSAAGTLQSNLSPQVIKLVLTGRMNAKDIKYMRQLINEGNLQSLDLTGAKVASGGGYYYKSYGTALNNMGDYCFQGFRKLVNINLPQTLTKIGTNAFSKTGLRTVVVPDKVTTIGEDAFAYCQQLSTVLIGKRVSSLAKGAFYESGVKDVYVLPLTPPSLSSYAFSSKPTIHVYASALEKYQATAWADYGTIVGDLTDDIVDGIEELEAPKNLSDSNIETYDLMGRKVTEFSPGNIYVRNGRKYIVK